MCKILCDTIPRNLYFNILSISTIKMLPSSGRKEFIFRDIAGSKLLLNV
jgi:hypothetical protein